MKIPNPYTTQLDKQTKNSHHVHLREFSDRKCKNLIWKFSPIQKTLKIYENYMAE